MKHSRFKYLFVLLAVCAATSSPALAAPAEKDIRIVFRYDDYSARSATDLERNILDAFHEMGAPVTFGVIPFICSGDAHDPSPQSVMPLTTEKQEMLKSFCRQGTLEVALHGYSHQSLGAAPFSEFSGMDYENQLKRIGEGKRFLEGIVDAPVTSFVPPWNLYDSNTLKALNALGFKIVSADSQGSRDGGKITFLPYTCDASALQKTVLAAEQGAETRYVIIALFHQYDFFEKDEKRGKMDLQGFRDLLLWVKSRPEVRLISLQQAGALKNYSRYDVSAESAR